MAQVLPAAARLGSRSSTTRHRRGRILNDLHLRLAKEHGCKIVVDTDAHATEELDQMRYGITQLRRAWLTADDLAQHAARGGAVGAAATDVGNRGSSGEIFLWTMPDLQLTSPQDHNRLIPKLALAAVVMAAVGAAVYFLNPRKTAEVRWRRLPSSHLTLCSTPRPVSVM